MKQFLFLFLFIPSLAVAQKIDHLASFRDLNGDSYFRFNYDNDFFAATDKDYTQGYNLELVAPVLKNNPLNFFLLDPKATVSKYGLSIEHIGFTPEQYQRPEIQFGDRPFAAAILLKSFLVATDTAKKTRTTSSLSLGIIGPGAFGREMQTGIHRLIDDKEPLGWQHQIENDVVLNYRLGYEKRVWSYNHLFSLQAHANAQLGTLFTHVSAGISSTVGLIDSPFTGDKKGFRLYLYAQPTLKLVGYDATLQSGLFNRNSAYTISAAAVERLTAQFHFGLVLKTRTLYFEYTRSLITREFETGHASAWGGVNIGFTF
ncbi:lipid A deacylase LpxR family protein [Pricia sp.]|uniref:lipid A deacylase LpxR family protein n=1 Tax=Pricia sp. TaxID=2268138 RepID=UPI0035941259